MVRILWIEGKRAEGPSFIPSLRRKGYTVEVVPNGSAALARLVEIDPDVVVLNAASLRTSGVRICRSLRERSQQLPVLVITGQNQAASDDACANVVLKLPFTARKLINRILPLIPHDGASILHVGPIRLDNEHRRVRCLGREARLTPRQAHLLRILMEHPGEVLEREMIFIQVWNTKFTDDTRTLDVHVSWLRQAIEADPRHPEFIKTVRGVGYRLDI